MRRFFFDFHDCDGAIRRDDVGQELGDLPAAREAAVQLAREIMAAEVLKGQLCISCWLVIRDEAGNYSETVQFGEALVMLGAHCSARPTSAT